MFVIRGTGGKINMVDVITPNGKWYIQITAFNEDCPYLCFPANYHGCKHPDRYTGVDICECNKKECPIWSLDRAD